MENQDFTATLLMGQSPKAAFDAINNVRGWWSEEIEGRTDHLNDEWTYRYSDVHRCKMKIIELTPHRKVVWHVLENQFKFTRDTSEWTGTKVIFEIAERGEKTEVRFIHEGLVPACECFEVCAAGWTTYITGSLRSLIETGCGHPNPKES